MLNDKRSELLDTFIEVKLPREDSFLLVKETLTRMGIPSNKEKKLYQSCHILHKKGRYYIVHFKEMFALDGKPSQMTPDDYTRRDLIASLLEEWELVDILTPQNKTDRAEVKIKIVPHSQKSEWELIPKYSIGGKRN
jgi:hypothetical protein